MFPVIDMNTMSSQLSEGRDLQPCLLDSRVNIYLILYPQVHFGIHIINPSCTREHPAIVRPICMEKHHVTDIINPLCIQKPNGTHC